MSILGRLGQLWELMKTVERVLTLEQKHSEAITDMRQQIDAMSRRLERLEYQVNGITTEAKAAARAGAQDVMAGAIADISRRIGILEAGAAFPKRVPRKPKDG